MVTFKLTADAYALDVVDEDDDVIGSLQWHRERSPSFIPRCDMLTPILISDLEQIVKKMDDIRVNGYGGWSRCS